MYQSLRIYHTLQGKNPTPKLFYYRIDVKFVSSYFKFVNGPCDGKLILQDFRF